MSEELEHSSLGPSGAHRWRYCPGSVAAEAVLPDKVGREAAEGTVFHEYAALCLEFGFEPEHFTVGFKQTRDGYEIEYDEDMVYHMRRGLDWARERMTDPNVQSFVEQRVDISPWCGPNQFGTCDLGIINVVESWIIIFDWKYGKGHPVSPVKNDQEYLYCLGFWNSYAKQWFKGVDPATIKVVFHIEQPRTTAGGGTWDTTMAEVLAEGELIREDAARTYQPNAPRIAGSKQCEFCRFKACPEKAAYALSIVQLKFDDIQEADELGLQPTLVDPATLPLEVRTWAALNQNFFKKWFKSMHDLTVHDLKSGKHTLAKIVAGKPGHRKYVDSSLDAATARMIELVGREKALETKLIGPPAAEKLIGKKRFKEEMSPFVTQPPGKPILVPLSDPREAMPDLVSRFDDLADEDIEDEDE